MKIERQRQKLFLEKTSYLWFVCVAAALCFSTVALSQSGRRKDSPQAPPVVVPPLPQPPPVHSILVGGHSIDDPDTKEIWATYRGTMAKACLKKLQEQPGPNWQVVDGGKISRKHAYETARQQKDSYVLWFGYKDVGSRYIFYVDFLLLAPQTGNIVMKGRIDPNASSDSRLPPRLRSIGEQLEDGGRLVAERVRARF
jgi:hypothetical protein